LAQREREQEAQQTEAAPILASTAMMLKLVAVSILGCLSLAEQAADQTAALAKIEALQQELAELRSATARVNSMLLDMPELAEHRQARLARQRQYSRHPGSAHTVYRRMTELEGPCGAEPGPAESLGGALNHLWLLICGALVMLMQAGFAMLESGACRAKNAQNLMLKNLFDICLGTLCWWSFGWMMAYGADTVPSTEFAGNKQYFGKDLIVDYEAGHKCPTDGILSWFFQWAFCGAAATIVSGGVAERINFPAYVVFTFCMTTFIYPIVVYWTWSGAGILYGPDAVTDVGYYDFAGSGIVHMTGGVGALMGAIILGPRAGRFTTDEANFAPHNMSFVCLGTFILWFGWYGFNCGSTLGMDSVGTGRLAAHVAMNTTIAAATGGLTVFLLRLAMLRRYDVGGLCNGILAGLVSITAPCGNVENYNAFFIAIIGGFVYQGASLLLKLLKIDDPLDAFPVHGACGAWGALAAVLFDWGKGMDYFNGWSGFTCTEGADGCYKDGWMSAFGAQVVGILCIASWVAVWSTIILLPLRLLGFLRASEEIQEMGMDVAKHSPSKAYAAGEEGNQVSSIKVHPTTAG